MRRLSLVWLAGLLAGVLAGPGVAQSRLSCASCHGEMELLRQHTGSLAQAESLRVPGAMLDASAHGDLDCSECHRGFDRFPHVGPTASESCASCHEPAATEWEAGSHAPTIGDGVVCAACHTVHAVQGTDALAEGPAMAAMVERCVACHETQVGDPDDPHTGEAPCYGCHAPHTALPPSEPESAIHARAQPETCGACHEAVTAAWVDDAHGRALAAADVVTEETPTCTSCHGAHPLVGPGSAAVAELTVERCAACHEHYAESFSDTYHGQANELGSEATATCADCHGAHDIYGAGHPESMVAETNLVETCASCHPRASESFVRFQPHADHHDREGNPALYWAYVLMTGLLVGTMAMFGLHTILWLVRIWLDARKGKAVPHLGRPDVPLDAAQRGSGGFVWRFPLRHRLTHGAVVISFFLLVFTGMPLRFSCAPWSAPLIQLMGGVEMAGLLHRIGAVITFGYFAAHLIFMARGLIQADDRRSLFRGKDSIVPQPQDAIDFLNQWRWYFGLRERPRFGRFSYMEKFDYFAVFWGVAVIGGTGLMLWFPEWFSSWLPGWVFNVATIIHADEAMLATLFIFTIHFFNVHLRPEKFPLDEVMFTGRATVEYMEEEHPLIMDRIEARGEAVGSGQTPDTPAPAPGRTQTLIGAVLGMLALGMGLVLIGMMTWAFLC